MKLSFDPDTLLPNVLPATLPEWVRHMPVAAPGVSSTYDLALVRRQQQLLRQLSATLAQQAAPAFLINHLDGVADLLGELVRPYLEQVDTLGEQAVEELEPEWLPDFSPLPLFWLPTDPAVEISDATVEAFDWVAQRPDALVLVSGGAAEVRAIRPDVKVVVVDYDELGQEGGDARVKELLGGIYDLNDWIPNYPQEGASGAADH